MDSVDVRCLRINESRQGDKELEICKISGQSKLWPKTPFPIDDQINQKVILYDGDLELLNAEALVNPTNENLTQMSSVSRLAGPELDDYLRKKVRFCSTGDVRLTPGFKSNFDHLIHAVPPKYQPKYKTAAETALFHTYFRILEIMIERRIRTIVIPTLITPKCNMPIEENYHMQLRVIRRFLEKKRREIDMIVVHVHDSVRFLQPFLCYFPRTKIDEEIACYNLDSSLGGHNGEPLIPERQIRIKGKPALLRSSVDQSIDLTSGLDLSICIGKTPFSKMREDLDKKVQVYKPAPKRSTCGIL